MWSISNCSLISFRCLPRTQFNINILFKVLFKVWHGGHTLVFIERLCHPCAAISHLLYLSYKVCFLITTGLTHLETETPATKVSFYYIFPHPYLHSPHISPIVWVIFILYSMVLLQCDHSHSMIFLGFMYLLPSFI